MNHRREDGRIGGNDMRLKQTTKPNRKCPVKGCVGFLKWRMEYNCEGPDGNMYRIHDVGYKCNMCGAEYKEVKK